MDKANHLVKKYRKNINPPYSRKDFPTIGGTIIAILLIPLILVFFQPVRVVQTTASQDGNLVGVSKREKFVSNEVLVKLRDSAKKKIKPGASPSKIGISSIEKTNKELKVKTFEQIVPKSKRGDKSDVSNWYKVKLPGKKKVLIAEFDGETGLIKSNDPASSALQKAIDEFRGDPNIEAVEPNFKVEIVVTPNDPYYSSSGSWGQSYPDLWGMKKINMAAAWDQTTGSRSVIVADIDTGVDRNHEDLKDNMWVNTGEIPNNGIDDDSNGYIDDYYGWDWVSNDNDPMDDHGHGTHVAGTIAGVGNNAKGVVGVNWTSKIMALKFLSSGGSGSLSNGIAALKYAADMGAKVSSNSWGCSCNSKAMDDAVAYEHDRGMVMVAAAGNNNGDTLDHSPSSADRAIAVAATDYADRKASFSNWGEKIDVAAPGVDILSTRAVVNPMCTASRTVGGKYCRVSGTSMATPHVAGLAALLWAKSAQLTNEEIRQIIRSGSTDLGTIGKDRNFGYGRINAVDSLSLVSTRPLAPIITSLVSRTKVSGSNLQIVGGVPGPGFVNYKLEVGSGRAPTSWTTVATSTTQVINGILATVDTTSLNDGKSIFRLTAKNNAGKSFQFQVHDIDIDNLPDTKPPVVRISNPAKGSTVSGTTLFYAIATDDDGVSKVEFFVDGVLKGTDTTYSYYIWWDTKKEYNGSHSLTARAYDAAGNTATSSAVSVNVSNQISFNFTVVGDLGDTANTTNVLNKIKNTNPDFHLALGDLSYLKTQNAVKNWVNNRVKATLGPTFPFEILAGNHDSGDPADTTFMDDVYIPRLPHRLSSQVTGTYGKEYYFDYPKVNPIARFILISPGGDIFNWSYSKGTTRYNWTANAIDDARSKGVKWVIVGSHENCIEMGTKSCGVSSGIGADIFNLLIQKKVDLVLQAHDHVYNRSKQLALGTNCTAIVPGSFNSNCVVGAGSNYTKDKGTVLVIQGTGGRALYNVNSSDSEAGYFAAWSGANIQPTHGPVKYTVTSNQITGQFLGVGGGTFTDSFTIRKFIPDTQKPSTPTSLRGRAVTSSRIDLAWNSSSDNVGVVGYRIYRNGTLIKRVSGVKYSDRSVRSGRTYYYYVRAYDAAGNVSNKSSTVKVTIPGTGAPRKLGDLNGDGKINIFDLSILLTRWRTTSKLADLNNSGRVDIFDLSILLSRWGR